MTLAVQYRYGCLVGDDWQPGGGAATETRNPARPAEPVGRYEWATVAQVAAAVERAAVAQRAWRRLPAMARIAAFGHFVAALERRGEDIARAIVREQGKPLAEARGELAKACGEARAMMALASRHAGEVLPAARPGFRNQVLRRPRGVIAAITPWNFPVMTPMRKIAPALLYGNAVVLKPSEFTPAAACIAADCARETLPAGLLQLVIGGADVGAALVSHPDVAGITFTGSTAIGRRIHALAAGNLAELSLELGGKNAAVIHDTRDLDAALDAIAGAAFACAGQRCTAVSRVLVRRALYPSVVDGLALRALALEAGDGLEDGVNLGPMVHAGHLDKVASMVAQGLAEGARLVCGGSALRPASAPDGHFYAPTVLADVHEDMQVAREEIFGPVITVQAYDDFDQALAIVNGVDYGLTAALFSDDHGIVQRFLDECETGMLHVNHGTVPDNHMPFGGVKQSGAGAYSVGASAIHFYTTEHSAYLRYA